MSTSNQCGDRGQSKGHILLAILHSCPLSLYPVHTTSLFLWDTHGTTSVILKEGEQESWSRGQALGTLQSAVLWGKAGQPAALSGGL